MGGLLLTSACESISDPITVNSDPSSHVTIDGDPMDVYDMWGGPFIGGRGPSGWEINVEMVPNSNTEYEVWYNVSLVCDFEEFGPERVVWQRGQTNQTVRIVVTDGRAYNKLFWDGAFTYDKIKSILDVKFEKSEAVKKTTDEEKGRVDEICSVGFHQSESGLCYVGFTLCLTENTEIGGKYTVTMAYDGGKHSKDVVLTEKCGAYKEFEIPCGSDAWKSLQSPHKFYDIFGFEVRRK